MKSMTAYARVEKIIEGINISFEIRSYNGRYLDLKVDLPFWLSKLEFFIREYFSSKILRGRVEISILSSRAGTSSGFTVDREKARSYNEALCEIADELKVKYNPNPEFIAGQQGVLIAKENDDLEKWKQELVWIFDLALEAFNSAKLEEGFACQKNIETQLEKITQAVLFIYKESLKAENFFEVALKKKLKDFLGNNYDENRILQEIAIMLVKYTINEELVRLQAHLKAMKTEMVKEGAIAKKLDFICQEMNREINTVASKSQSYKISEQVIIVKEALENIREQLKNLE